MRSVLRLVVVAVCAGAVSAAFAQTAGSEHGPVVLKGAPLQSDCPVRFSVHRPGGAVALRETRNGPVSEYRQTLQLRFEPARTPGIERMVVRVYGTTAEARMVPAGRPEAPDVVSPPIELTSSGGHFPAMQSITTSTVPLVTRVEITEIVYRDGTRVKQTGCSAAPSLFVLVGAEASSR